MQLFQIVSFFAIAKAAKTERIPTSTSSQMPPDHGRSESVRIKRELPVGYNIPLEREQNGPAYVTITTGDPNARGIRRFTATGVQTFKLLFDTGSLPTWINGIATEGNFYRTKDNVFDLLQRKLLFKIHYTEGSWAQGTYYYDNVCIVTDEQNQHLCADKTYFGLVNHKSMGKHGNIDGVFGMANYKDTTPHQQEESGDNYFPQYTIAKRITEVKGLPGIIGLSLTRTGGMLTIGSQNDELMDANETVYWINVQMNPMRYWQLKGTSFVVRFDTFAFTTAILNSGVEEILAPNDVVHRVYTLLKANNQGYFRCNETRLQPYFYFQFGSYTVILEAEDYIIIEYREGGKVCCRIGMKNSNSPDVWHLGLIFMRKRYIVFNITGSHSKVGFIPPADAFEEDWLNFREHTSTPNP